MTHTWQHVWAVPMLLLGWHTMGVAWNGQGTGLGALGVAQLANVQYLGLWPHSGVWGFLWVRCGQGGVLWVMRAALGLFRGWREREATIFLFGFYKWVNGWAGPLLSQGSPLPTPFACAALVLLAMQCFMACIRI